MRTVRRGFVVAIALSTVVFTSTAMAGKGGVKGSNSAAPPGQAGTSPGQAGALGSPGQVFKSEKNDLLAVPGSALSPGQKFNQGRDSLPPALPPGQTFGTPGNPIPGSLQ
jgi:hypothetical protein